MNRRFVIIVNPAAGRRKAVALAEAVQERLTRCGAGCRVEVTSAPGDAQAITRAVLCEDDERRPCVVACSGDGTVQEVVNALLNNPAAGGLLGLAPGGRCNDFASTLGIPRDPESIADVLLGESSRRVDVGRAGERYFCTIAAMGFDAAVSRYVNDTALPFTGTLAYVLGTLRLLLTYKPRRVHLTLGETVVQEEVFLVASANTDCYGGQMRVAPEADMCDGLLEVCIVSKLSRLRGLRLLQAVLRGRHSTLQDVRFIKTRSMTIETPKPEEVWADGEFIGTTPLTIEIVPQALEVLAPQVEPQDGPQDGPKDGPQDGPQDEPSEKPPID